MRNPFRRQTETAAPTLRERAADLSSRLAASKPQTEATTESTAQDGATTQSDPALATIEEGRRLLAASRDAFKLPDVGINPHPDRDAAQDAVWAHFRESVAKVIPSTARGCGALAQYATEFQNFQGVEVGEEALEILGHIARSPMLDVEARADALPAAILDGWAAWGATTGFGVDASAEEVTAWEQASAYLDRLLYAAMALPATPENIPAKALACAWMEWVNVEQPGKPRSAYGPADQLVYDINATIMARDTAGTRPVELPSSALVPTVDFAGATMRELWAIREAANLVCEVSGAATWQGCNRLADHPTGAAVHNEADKLMRWVSDAMCHVAGEAEKEARRRTPENSDDRGTRLVMLAGITVDNEDPAEIAAFARELLAMVEP